MPKNESKFWKQIREHKCKISWTRLENSAAHGTPDLLGYNKYNKFFTVELKVSLSKFPRLSPHQISFHIRHPKNSFIMVKYLPKALEPSGIKLYEGTAVHALVGGALPMPTPVACGLSACCLFLENLK
tara:strand:+ start:482 stop:865 length:384 start_codon:yes stop_codon:yes gene_type:complete